MGSELVLQEEQPAAPPSGGALVALAVLPGLGAPTQYNTTYPRSKLWEDPDAGCQKKCCQTQGRYLTLQIGDKQGDELKKARKAKQLAAIHDAFDEHYNDVNTKSIIEEKPRKQQKMQAIYADIDAVLMDRD